MREQLFLGLAERQARTGCQRSPKIRATLTNMDIRAMPSSFAEAGVAIVGFCGK